MPKFEVIDFPCPACLDPHGVQLSKVGPAMICIVCDRLFWGKRSYSYNAGGEVWGFGSRQSRIIRVKDINDYEWEYLEDYHPIQVALDDPLGLLGSDLLRVLEELTTPYGGY